VSEKNPFTWQFRSSNILLSSSLYRYAIFGAFVEATGKRVIVVGGGVIGAAVSARLQEDGHQVLLIERSGIGEGCSSGNSGLVSVSGSVPLASPGLVRSLPRLLLDHGGPLTVNLAYLPRVLPWLVRMIRASAWAEVERISAALARLLEHAQPALLALAERAGCANLIRRFGTLSVFETERSFRAAAPEYELRRRHGVVMQELSAHELREMEPALSNCFDRAFLIPGNAHCVDPLQLVKEIFNYFLRRQGRWLKGSVERIVGRDGDADVHTSDGQRLSADYLVLAAGAWTAGLLRPIGARILLAPHRGYHVMLGSPEMQLTRPLMWGERGFAIVPMLHGIRAAGLVEMADADREPDYRHAERIRSHVQRALPRASFAQTATWMGVRPATPDSLPVIGAVPGFDHILVATGHGHLGLTFSAITGSLIADLISKRRPQVDISSFSVARFA
jgi:glycine/D-amino acid oxidase-like deaminating enzyme